MCQPHVQLINVLRSGAAQFSLARKKKGVAGYRSALPAGPHASSPSQQLERPPSSDSDAHFAQQESQRMLDAMSRDEVRIVSKSCIRAPSCPELGFAHKST